MTRLNVRFYNSRLMAWLLWNEGAMWIRRTVCFLWGHQWVPDISDPEHEVSCYRCMIFRQETAREVESMKESDADALVHLGCSVVGGLVLLALATMVVIAVIKWLW